MAEGKEAVSSLEAQLAAVLSAKVDIEAQLAAARSAKADTEAQLAAARSAKADVEAQLAAAQSAKAEVQAAASAVDGKLAAACKTTQALQAHLQELQQQHEGLQMQKEELQQQSGALQAQLQELQQQHEGLQVQKEELQQQSEALQTQVEEQQQQLEEAAAAAALLAPGQQTKQREVAVQTHCSLQDASTGPDAAPGSWQPVGCQTEPCTGLPGVAHAPGQHKDCQIELHANTSSNSAAHSAVDGAGHVLLETAQLRHVAGPASAGRSCCSRLVEVQTQTDLRAPEHQPAGDSCCSRLAAAQTQADLSAPEQQEGQGQTVCVGTQSDRSCSVAQVGVQAQPSTLDAANVTDVASAIAGLDVGCQTDVFIQVVAPQPSTRSQTDHEVASEIEDGAADQQQQQDTVAAAAAGAVDGSSSFEPRTGTAAAEGSQPDTQVNSAASLPLSSSWHVAVCQSEKFFCL